MRRTVKPEKTVRKEKEGAREGRKARGRGMQKASRSSLALFLPSSPLCVWRTQPPGRQLPIACPLTVPGLLWPSVGHTAVGSDQTHIK